MHWVEAFGLYISIVIVNLEQEQLVWPEKKATKKMRI